MHIRRTLALLFSSQYYQAFLTQVVGSTKAAANRLGLRFDLGSLFCCVAPGLRKSSFGLG